MTDTTTTLIEPNPFPEDMPELTEVARRLLNHAADCMQADGRPVTAQELRKLGEALYNAARSHRPDLATAIVYEIDEETTAERVRQKFGSEKWAVRRNGRVLNKQGEWEWEPMPSSRDEEFLARCRFPTFVEAIDAARAKEGKA